MFDINKYLLIKMGWSLPNRHKRYKVGNKIQGVVQNFPISVTDEDQISFIYDDVSISKCFLILETLEKVKQIEQKSYKFVIVDYATDRPKFIKSKLLSNSQLFKLIIKNEACNEDYKRHFKLTKILNEKRS